MSTPANPPAGWYDDVATGRQRWFDGSQWTDHYQAMPATPAMAAPHPSSVGPMTSSQLKVNREVNYVRQQKGHSLTKHLLLGIFVLYIDVIYISVSPNHYWHA